MSNLDGAYRDLWDSFEYRVPWDLFKYSVLCDSFEYRFLWDLCYPPKGLISDQNPL